MQKKPIMLMILDGFGINPNPKGNAICEAKKPNLDKILSTYPNTKVKTSGLDVGLPEGQMGNSEVGHTNIGAGRIAYQELTRITKSIKDGEFFENKELNAAIENCKKNNSNLHLMGLLSDGGVHSHNTHLYGILELARKKNFTNVYVHCFLDGRDTPPASGIEYLQELEDKIQETGVGNIATVMGRYYAMDRDKRWERVELAYNAICYGKGEIAKNSKEAIENSYKAEKYDEFVKPTVIVDEKSNPTATIKEKDSVIFYNFRPDRAREITRTIVDENFDGFERKYFPTTYVCFTQYEESMPNVLVAFSSTALKNTFGEYISNQNLTQLRIAETEKYAHVTFFFNGGEEKQYKGEDRILVQSPRVATYDLKPEMSAYEVTDKVIEAIESKKYDCIILNYANCDMVGHTGIMEAAVKAVETVDECAGSVCEKILENDGILLITADHGNADQMIDYGTGKPFTAHTTYEVPLILVGANEDTTLKSGRLADLAPTMLALMGLKKPEEMTGESLIG